MMNHDENIFLNLLKEDESDNGIRSLSYQASHETWNLIISNHPELQVEIAQNRLLPDETIMLLTASNSITVRTILAEKRKLPYEAFLKLAKDESESVRMTVASNKKIPDSILTLLCEDGCDEVVRIAKTNFYSRSK
ncbi:hypothetical protein V8J88_10920 [Massilia sp. W12]|uniref:hypothetical protein n=1 Tax=Massilia sp. W12 TaxID=3126507 RepID=UPI0030D409DE